MTEKRKKRHRSLLSERELFRFIDQLTVVRESRKMFHVISFKSGGWEEWKRISYNEAWSVSNVWHPLT